MLLKAGEIRDEKLVQYVKNLKPKIKQLTIFPTELCNYRCKMCHIWGETGWALKEPEKIISEQLDIDVIKNFINQTVGDNNSGKNKIGIVVTGGEPMLYKHFAELATFIRSKKLPLYLVTNGALIKDNIDTILDTTIAMNISLDGPEPFHDAVRQKDSFKQVCENIEILIDKKRSTRKRFPYINIGMTISETNYTSVKEFLPSLRKRFMDAKIILHQIKNPWLEKRDLAVHFQPLFFTTTQKGEKYAEEMQKNLNCSVSNGWQGFVNNDVQIDSQVLQSDFEEIWHEEGVDSSSFINLDDYFSDIENVFGRSRCLAPWHELIIRRTGDVYPCVDLPDYKLGNIYQNGFDDIWNGSKLEKFRNYLKNKRFDLCNRCTRLWADKESF